LEYDPSVKLHVCYGTFGTAERHPCKKAHTALRDAGYEPQIVRTNIVAWAAASPASEAHREHNPVARSVVDGR